MLRARIVLFVLFLWPHCAFAGETYVKVVQVINGKSLVLASGDVVRLASIEAPNVQEVNMPGKPGRPGEPLGDESRQALVTLTQDKEVRIDTNLGERDRHNRLLGQAYTKDGVWLQGEMLRRGYAMVYSFSDDEHDVIVKMLAAEREARAMGLGIWANSYFRVIHPEEANEFINRFKLVEGKVVSVNDYKGHTYINFSEHWKGNFAIFISRKFAKAFEAMDVKSLAGKTVRVRGWINYHNAPMIDISHPEQIEVE